MCLVLSVALTALAVNFYLNGFLLQTFITGALALMFLIVMIRNVKCREKGCAMNYKAKEDKR
jgi:hypothetical protein